MQNPLEQPLESINLIDLVDQPAWKTILIDLVKSEKMNPWEIDLVDLANKYYQKILAMEKTDLKLPANAILASAILLKFKARAIRISSIEELEDDLTKEVSEKEIRFLEENLPELRHGRQLRSGKISLDDLVENITLILDKTKSRGNILREKEIPDFKVVLDNKDIEEQIKNVFSLIKQKTDSRGIARFSQLSKDKSAQETIGIFLPVLFLTNQGKINIWQESFWQEIFIALEGSDVKLPAE